MCGFNEWYVFFPFDVGQLRHGNVFETLMTPGQVCTFVNFFGFALRDPEISSMVEHSAVNQTTEHHKPLFWRHIAAQRPPLIVPQQCPGVWRLRWTGLFLRFQLAARKTSSSIRFASGAFPYEPWRWSARLKVESELLTSAANAIVKT